MISHNFYLIFYFYTKTMLPSSSTAVFLDVGNEIMGWRHTAASSSSTTTTNRRFRSAFGINPLICRHVWNLIANSPKSINVPTARPKHLLWALLFLKQYNSTELNAAITGADKKTFRKWTWIFVTLMSDLKVVSRNLLINLFSI